MTTVIGHPLSWKWRSTYVEVARPFPDAKDWSARLLCVRPRVKGVILGNDDDRQKLPQELIRQTGSHEN